MHNAVRVLNSCVLLRFKGNFHRSSIEKGRIEIKEIMELLGVFFFIDTTLVEIKKRMKINEEIENEVMKNAFFLYR